MNGPLRTLSTIWILLLSALTRAHDVRYIGTWWYNYGYRYSETWDSYASISVDLTIDDWSEVVIQAEGYYGAVAMSSYEARELQVTVGGEVQTVAPGEVTIPRSAFGSLTMGEVVLSVPPACDGTTTIASQPSTRTNAATPESSGGQESLTSSPSGLDYSATANASTTTVVLGTIQTAVQGIANTSSSQNSDATNSTVPLIGSVSHPTSINIGLVLGLSFGAIALICLCAITAIFYLRKQKPRKALSIEGLNEPYRSSKTPDSQLYIMVTKSTVQLVSTPLRTEVVQPRRENAATTELWDGETDAPEYITPRTTRTLPAFLAAWSTSHAG